MDAVPFVLASGSPRRRELLARILGEHGFHWSAAVFDEEDGGTEGLPPADLVLRLADGKREAWTEERAHGAFAECFVLGADTVVALGDEVLGKPRDAADARRMLRALSGRRHDVVTGLSLAYVRDGRTVACVRDAVETEVRFAELPEALVEWYAATGEPLDKAGAYGIQGHGALLVERIDGCYYNVMGFPLRRLYELMRELQEIPGVPRIDSSLFPLRDGRDDGREGKGTDGCDARDDAGPARGRPPV